MGRLGHRVVSEQSTPLVSSKASIVQVLVAIWGPKVLVSQEGKKITDYPAVPALLHIFIGLWPWYL